MQAGRIGDIAADPAPALLAAKGLGELIHERLERSPDALVSILVGADGTDRAVSAGDLACRAAGFAQRLGRAQGGVRKIVAITLYQGLDLHAAWIGAVWAGHIPTMVAPPSMRMESAKFAAGFSGIMQRIKADVQIVDRATAAKLGAHIADLPALVAEDVADGDPGAGATPLARDDIVLIQHSSGSTGLQKAVALTSRQVVDHNAAYCETLGITTDDTIVSWLPLYHDMGFVACFLLPFLQGIKLVELSPFDWVLRPQSLLHAVSRHRGTLCWMPNFAFSFLAQNAKHEPGAPSPNLSSMRAWVNCSEPVMASSMQKFVDRFASCGVGWHQMSASYAMAENVFAVTQVQPGCMRELMADRHAFHADHVVRVPAQDVTNGLVFATSGKPLPTTELQIRGSTGESLRDGEVGEIWLRGTHRFSGYYGNDELTHSAIDNEGWYQTGDLGFFDQGEIFVTGRSKDLIIIQGRNFYPNDIEAAVGGIDGIAAGRVVAFGVTDDATGTEQLVVLAEADAANSANWHVLALRVRNGIAQEFNCTPTDVRIVPSRWLVKSTSGKPARSDNRAKYVAQFREGRDV